MAVNQNSSIGSFFSFLFAKSKFQISGFTLCLMFSVILIGFYNPSLWAYLDKTIMGTEIGHIGFIASFFAVLVILLNFVLTLCFFRGLQKSVMILLLFLSAGASYYMTYYGIVIDKSMIQNVAETDFHEARETVNSGFFLHLLLLGVLPSLIILKVTIKPRPLSSKLLSTFIISLSSLVLLVGILLPQYKDFSSFTRNHRDVRYRIIPTNVIYYGIKYLVGEGNAHQIEVKPLGTDAKLTSQWDNIDKPVVMVLVLGETARAHNFSLDGYTRSTNPELTKQDIVYFDNVSSCGTSTAISVPCMFSVLNRDDYSLKEARSNENILDVFKHAGFNVIWLDNNSGCKGVCSRVTTKMSSEFSDPKWCEDGRCHDEVLLPEMSLYLQQNPSDKTLIVLHQLGSHGPTYWKRYPEKFKRFTPVCESSDLSECSPEEITNAYDNTILYTDHFLSQLIDYLKVKNNIDSGMLYISDHGESLGENGIYLHGLPYFMAPDYQTHIPMLTWFSEGFKHDFGININCLKQSSERSLSQDNLFHSLLGLLQVKTLVYQPKLDLFKDCQK
ncbi:phosphoethanolamine transferase [Parashewanella tropica]|uniref:phosphoethanolamine transferase n=1 Tax=Parashewanella tropica TaxID=2547970 RepID=UPI001059B4E2|nr:phosphoethanolamine--lipid A transferase [Parashewanella tropica]